MLEYIFAGLLLGWLVGGNLASALKDEPPKTWGSEGHADMMLICKSMCGEVPVVKYEPTTGSCQCRGQ